jgi:hypothetical protein
MVVRSRVTELAMVVGDRENSLADQNSRIEDASAPSLPPVENL